MKNWNGLLPLCIATVLSIPAHGAAQQTATNGKSPAAPASVLSCADSDGCGEKASTAARHGSVLTADEFFSHVAGQEPLLAFLKDDQSDLRHAAGAELRYRYMDEENRLRPGGPGQSNYQLWRFTPWVSAGYRDRVSVYAQFIDASIFGLDAPYSPLTIDENRADLLQGYVDLNIGKIGDGTLHYRYGRQFLQYGAQRLLSPLGWGNTMRNFEGHKLMYSSKNFDVDAFAMQSVNAAAGNFFHPRSFDTPDQSRWIMGVYSSYKGIENNVVDAYYLYFDEKQSSAALMDGSRHTLGMRVAGKAPVKQADKITGTWNWDVEGAWQFGEDNFGSPAMRQVQAGMAGALGGYTFDAVPWKPGVGGIFYWGSGSSDPTTGRISTFNTLYPLGHAFWGQIDNLSGQNLLDYGIQGSLQPHEKFSFISQWHYFDLASGTDRIYNVAGAALTGGGARNIGNELDFVGTLAVSKTLNVQAGYFWFWYGDAITGGPLNRPDASQFYTQITWQF